MLVCFININDGFSLFSEWLNTDKLASWDKLIEALTLIGLDKVASNIKQLLGLQGEFD